MLSNGARGDVNNINFRQPRKGGEPFSRIHAVAARVVDAAEQAYRQIEHQDKATLAMAEGEIALAVRKPNADELPRAQAVLARAEDKGLPRLARYYADSCVRVSRYRDTVKIKP